MGKKLFTVKLSNKSSYQTMDAVRVHAEHIIKAWEADPGSMPGIIKELKMAVKKRTERFSEMDEVYQALTTASFRKDEKTGIVEVGQQGPTQIPWKIAEVRKNSLIRGLIDKDIERQLNLGLLESEIDEVSIKLDADHTYYMASLMVKRLSFIEVSTDSALVLYDKMVDLEADSQKIIKKKSESKD